MGSKRRIGGITSNKNGGDRPLYVQVREGDSSLWFVIEDGRQQQQQQQQDSLGCDDADHDDILFRRLDLPDLGYQRFPVSILAINSKLYLLGGSKSSNKPRPPVAAGEIQYLDTVPSREYEFLDLLEKKLRWRRQSFCKYLPYTPHVASGKDGLIYGFGPTSYIVDPSRRSGGVVFTELLPEIANRDFGHVPQPLSVSQNKIYAFSHGGVREKPNLQHYLFSYDMEEKKWDCIFKNFWGDWATGVVLLVHSEDSYLVVYGSRHPIEWKREKPGVWVFDIRWRQWLDEPVQGLDEALPVIPDWVYEYWDCPYTYYLPRLFQIGTHRFALLWEDTSLSWETNTNENFKLHCHKFTLQAPNSTDQPFVARELSNKIITLNGSKNSILGCTVGLQTERS